jgi:hypothetical protein
MIWLNGNCVHLAMQAYYCSCCGGSTWQATVLLPTPPLPLSTSTTFFTCFTPAPPPAFSESAMHTSPRTLSLRTFDKKLWSFAGARRSQCAVSRNNAAQAEERDALFTEVAQINAILISIAAATAENVAAVEQLARNADVLAQKGTEQHNLLQQVLTRLARFEAARTSAPQNVERQTVDMAPARTTGIAATLSLCCVNTACNYPDVC